MTATFISVIELLIIASNKCKILLCKIIVNRDVFQKMQLFIECFLFQGYFTVYDNCGRSIVFDKLGFAYELYIELTIANLISTCTSSAPTVNTLNDLAVFKFRFGYSAYTGGSKVCIFWLYASQAAHSFETRLE